ncbi:hypothetical protein HY797_02535 [Candidatus Falkowbacteria bacterium]|nr:hypothetical protein [Candidatus Falkowbacteria bacterium]
MNIDEQSKELITGLDGQPVLDLFDAMNHNLADIAPTEFGYDQEREELQVWLDDLTEELVIGFLNSRGKNANGDYLALVNEDEDMEPDMELEEGDYRPKFHGVTRLNIFKKSKITYAEPNAKRRWCKCRNRKNIREYHFNEWFADATL